MLWKPHGGGPGHASLAITRPSKIQGNECVAVITWFPKGERDAAGSSSAGRLDAYQDHDVPVSVYEEMSRFMAQGREREVYLPGVPREQRPMSRFKPPSHICRLTSLSDLDAMTGLSDVNMLSWWETYKARKDYNLVTRNCSTAVAGGLLAGGGSVQCCFFRFPFKFKVSTAHEGRHSRSGDAY